MDQNPRDFVASLLFPPGWGLFVPLAAALLIAVLVAVRAAPRDTARAHVRGIRVGSVIGVLATVLMVANCSATGLGSGCELMLAPPLPYLAAMLPFLAGLGRRAPSRGTP